MEGSGATNGLEKILSDLNYLTNYTEQGQEKPKDYYRKLESLANAVFQNQSQLPLVKEMFADRSDLQTDFETAYAFAPLERRKATAAAGKAEEARPAHRGEQRTVICKQSQGMLHGNIGRNICASVVLKAAETLLKGGSFRNQTEIYEVIQEGFDHHIAREYGDSKKEFNELLRSGDGEAAGLVSLKVPLTKEAQEFIPFMDEEGRFNLEHSQQKETSEGFALTLKQLDEFRKDRPAVGVVACAGETILLSFTEEGKPFVFDSHYKTAERLQEEELEHGASTKVFDSNEECDRYLQTVYPAEKTESQNFSVTYVSLDEAAQREVAVAQEEKSSVQDEVAAASPVAKKMGSAWMRIKGILGKKDG